MGVNWRNTTSGRKRIALLQAVGKKFRAIELALEPYRRIHNRIAFELRCQDREKYNIIN